jgi:SecA-like ATPase subunit of protein translocation complex
MIVALARKLFGSSSEPRIKRCMPRVAQINALEKDLEKLSDDALRAHTEAFKKRVAVGDSNPASSRRRAPPPKWCTRMESNHRRAALQTAALPLSYSCNVWCGRRESNPPRRSGTPRPNQ